MYENLIYSVESGVCRIVLNRPKVYNALNPGLIQDITNAVLAAGANESVRVVTITGAGDKAFCSGADLKTGFEQSQAGVSMGASLRTTYHPMIRAIRNLPKPVVARVNGVAAGAGASLALACDAIICTDEAYFSQIFINIGLMPDAGSTFFLPRLVGPLKAFELASTGRRVYGPEAASIGLATRSVPDLLLDETVTEVVDYYAKAPTRAIGLMKLAMNQSVESNLEIQLEREAAGQDELGRSHDAIEGIGAFLLKKKPNFLGK